MSKHFLSSLCVLVLVIMEQWAIYSKVPIGDVLLIFEVDSSTDNKPLHILMLDYHLFAEFNILMIKK